MKPASVLFNCILWISFISIGHALECYVCTRQEDNVEKCLNTIRTCEQYEDVCQSEITWGSTPYWSQGALKQYYVSKRCATKEQCIKTRQRNMQYCSHIWYEDWACSECCQGDRCNYYVMSGGDSTRFNQLVTFAALISLFTIRYTKIL